MIRIPVGLAPFFLLVSAGAEITFTNLRAEDLVKNYLGDPNGIVQFRNIESSAHSCYALFANGHSTGKNTQGNSGAAKSTANRQPPTNNHEYLIPDRGIILSTGNPLDFAENDSGETTTDFRVDTGEPVLESQLPNDANVFDPCYIEFEFQCPRESEIYIPTVNLDYVFGSEEYYNAEHNGVASDYNDAFGVFLNGENIALVPDGNGGAPVSVNNINSEVNSEYFIENKLAGRTNMTSQYMDIEADGFTTELKVSTEALPGWNSIKLVIGDVGDGSLDSFVLIAGSLSCIEGAAIPGTPPSITLRDKVQDDAPSITLQDKVQDDAPSITLQDKVQDDGPSTRAFRIPMPIAVGLAVMMGLLGLAMPVIGATFYKKRFSQSKPVEV